MLTVQFLRFIAALLVVLSHANYISSACWPNSSSRSVDYLFNFGHSGVHIFFVISGFVMVFSTFSQSPPMSSQTFLFRRFLRIYPIYWLYALFYLTRKMFDAGTIPITDVTKSLLLLPGNSALLIPQGWTLSYEVYFYLCFGAIITLGMNRGLMFLAIAFLTMISLRGVLPTSNPFVDLVSNSLLLEFISGCAVAAAMLNGVRPSGLVCNVIIAASIVIFGMGFYIGYEKAPSALVWGIPSAMFVGGLAFRELERGTPNYVRRLAFLGDSSYSLYLLHVIVLGGLFDASSLMFSVAEPVRLILCAAFSAFCVVVSIICYNGIEAKIVRLRLRKTGTTVANNI